MGESQVQQSESLEEKILSQLGAITNRLADLEKQIKGKASGGSMDNASKINIPPSKVSQRLSEKFSSGPNDMVKSISLASPSEYGISPPVNFEERNASLPKTMDINHANEPTPFDASEYTD